MIEVVVRERCISCDICIDVCPTRVFDRDHDGVPRIARQDDCQTCFQCEAYCPTDALFVAPLAQAVAAELFKRNTRVEPSKRRLVETRKAVEDGWLPSPIGLGHQAGAPPQPIDDERLINKYIIINNLCDNSETAVLPNGHICRNLDLNTAGWDFIIEISRKARKNSLVISQ